MIVIDASAAIELLLRTDLGLKIESRALNPGEKLCAPHLLDLEVAQVMRRLVQMREVSASRAQQVLDDYQALSIERSGNAELLRRIWELRESLTAYDAAYVVLAEALASPLLTCDAKLLRAHGHRAEIELVQ